MGEQPVPSSASDLHSTTIAGGCAAPGHSSLDGIADLDTDRAARRGYPEAVFGEGKSLDQLRAIARAIAAAAPATADVADSPTGSSPHAARRLHHTPAAPTLFTRVDRERAAAILEVLPDAFHDEVARLVVWPPTPPEPTGGTVVVACAGTSDLPVAREATHTARFLGREVVEIVDAGVAGLHRIVGHLPTLREAAAIVVVAGMDGALPSVVAGQVAAPVIACPTSVGYGAAFEGLAPLLAMLNACAPGVAVVNIDNGYGAGHMAAQIAAPRRDDAIPRPRHRQHNDHVGARREEATHD